MKQKIALYCAILAAFIAATSQAQHFPTVLNDAISQTALGQNTRKVTILIHGWQPCRGSGNAYASGSLYNLSQYLESPFLGTEWQLVLYHWEQDADTANPLLCNLDVPSATVAASNALLHGAKIAQLLNQQAPNLRQVHLIAHSAGIWAAYQAAHDLLQTNPFVTIQITLLDGYVPNTGSLTTTTIESLATMQGSDRIFWLENYHAALQNGDLADIQAGVNHTFNWRSNIDINLIVSFWSLMNGVNVGCYYDHDGPIDFYADSVLATLPIGQGSVSGCLAGESFSFTDYGFYKSLFYERYFLPVIASNPQSQSANSGASALLQVAASSSQAMSYQWFLNGQRINGATSASYSFTLNSTTAGDYVVEVSNQYGFVFSDKATVSIVAAAAPTTTSVSPTSLPTSSSMQLINIYGTNFKPAGNLNASTLIFRDPANNPYVRTPIYVSANQLQYNVTVQSATGTWSVIVTNAGLAVSNPQTFSVYTAPANTGSLVVNLLPSGTTTAGAQWLLNSSYHNSGDVVASLTPGQYAVSFKFVSGYTTPASFTVNIVANAQTTTNATYTAVAPTTYTLTLNANNAQGNVSVSPTTSGNIYNSGSVVQLTAYANTGYHFTSWSGDASGTANTTTVTMNTAKNVTANFASGDPNLAIMTVTIKPDAAANVGVTWSVTGDSQLRASGTSLSEAVGSGYIAYLPVTLNLVAGWLGTNGATSFYVPITAGIVTNVTLTCVPDTTPGLLTVTLSPPDAVNAGAHWHVNGGAYGNGASVSLSPGNYTVTFDNVSGWTAPASQPVVMLPSQTQVLAGNYAPPAGQPAIISISPPLGPNSGGTLMTINGVNFAATTNVLIGGHSASNVTISSATQVTCLTPPSTTNGSVSVVVRTTNGSATNSNGFAYGITRGTKLDFVSAIGGSCLGVTVQGNHAYVGEGRNLLVLDVSTPSNPSKIGQVTLPGIIRSVALFQQYACVADEEGGLQIVDISTPTSPKVAGFYTTTNEMWSAGISILGGRAYVADESSGLQIFDLGNPAQPVLLGSTNVGGSVAVITKASTNGVFAYISTGGSLCIVDVSNPLTPTLVGQTGMGSGGVFSIAMSGNYVFGACLFDFSIHMVDISNPALPVDSKPGAGGYGSCIPYAMTFANNYLYVASGVNSYGLLVFSINGNDLTKVGQSANFTSSGYNLFALGTKAYVAAGGGFDIVDVSSPSSPSLLSSFTDSGVFHSYNSVAVTGNSLAACGYPEGEGTGFNSIFNVNNPSAPAFAANPNTGGSYVLANNGLAYVLAGRSNFIYNISTPSSPQLLKLFSNTAVPGISMSLAGSMLYVVGYSAGNQPHFAAIDVSTPSSPVVRGTKDFTEFSSGIATSVAVSGTKALIGIQTSVLNEVAVLDISNLAAPVERGVFTNLSSDPRGIQFSSDGNFGYILVAGRPSALYVLNVSQASNPSLVTNIPLDVASGTDLKIQGNELYATTFRGLYVFDVSNPLSPVLTRTYSILSEVEGIGLCSDLASQAGNIYLVTLDGGLVVLREQDIQAPDVYITDPIFGPVWTTTTSSLSLGGGSDDNVGVTAITWANNRGGSGQVSAPLDNWFVSSIKLYPGTNILTVTAFDPTGNSGTDTLTVIYQTTNQNQTLTFPAIADHTFGDAPITLVAAASSGLPVTFTVISGPAVLSVSNVLTLTGAGAVTVEADQSGNSGFNPATPVDASFNVARANQSIAFAPVPNHSAGDAPFALTATTSSGLPVYFNILSGPAINSNNIVTLLGGGAVTAIAWQPGNSNYNAAATVQQSFTISKIPQTITFGALSPQKQGDAPFPLNATSDSGLSVNFSVSGPATLNGNIVTLAGHGTVNVTASQSGNNSYAAATPVIQSFSVAPPDNTLIVLGFQNRSFQMAFYGMAGSNYTVQASSNLLNWQPFTNFTITNSPYSFIDPATTNFNRRFYRAMP